MIENLPAMQETWAQSLGQENPLEKGMATHSSTLAWRIPLTDESSLLQSMELQRVGHNQANNVPNKAKIVTDPTDMFKYSSLELFIRNLQTEILAVFQDQETLLRNCHQTHL